jgi:hypothetical protein
MKLWRGNCRMSLTGSMQQSSIGDSKGCNILFLPGLSLQVDPEVEPKDQ